MDGAAEGSLLPVTKSKPDLILAIIMIVLGVLILAGSASISQFIWIFGIALIVVGVLMVLKTLAGGMLMGIIAIVLGGLIVIPNNLLPKLGPLLGILDLIVGVLLLVFGIIKLMGK